MLATTKRTLSDALDGRVPDDAAALALTAETDLASLMETADRLNRAAHHNVVSYSRKVFIPLTQLCRDVCHYCTFAKPPVPGQRA